MFIFSHLDACTETSCEHYAKCELSVDGSPECVCPSIKNCPAVIKAVCGSNGKSYINKCRLMVDSCKKKKKILVDKEGICGKLVRDNNVLYATFKLTVTTQILTAFLCWHASS